jgi:hypothetical protein
MSSMGLGRSDFGSHWQDGCAASPHHTHKRSWITRYGVQALIRPRVHSSQLATAGRRFNDQFALQKPSNRKCLRWVKRRKTRVEQMFSAVPLIADMMRRSRLVRFVPIAEVESASPRIANYWTRGSLIRNDAPP